FWVKVRIWEACWMMFSLTVKLALPVPDTWHPGTAQLVLMMVDTEPDNVEVLSMQISSSGFRSSSFSLLQASRTDKAIHTLRYFMIFMVDQVYWFWYMLISFHCPWGTAIPPCPKEDAARGRILLEEVL